jgi:hypothetical protein
MRTVIGGDGSDTTAAVAAYLCDRHQYIMANLILIGEPEDPRSVWLTDWDAPLVYSIWGTFCPDVISRGKVSSKIGFEVSTLALEWSPNNPGPISQSIDTANPYQLAQMGLYDNLPVRVWTVYMPTPGDANTFGCSELFGGRISDVTVERGKITFEVTSFLDVVNLNVPTNVIELTNTLAAYKGATPPAGLSVVPQFSIIAGSTESRLLCAETSPNVNQIFADNALRYGFVVFNRGGSNTLGGVWSGVYVNRRTTTGSGDVNEIILYTPLPWPPTPGVDTCYISAAFPVNKDDGEYFGFPYVPSPSSAV